MQRQGQGVQRTVAGAGCLPKTFLNRSTFGDSTHFRSVRCSTTTSTRACTCCALSPLAAWTTSPRTTSARVASRLCSPSSSPWVATSSRPSRQSPLASAAVQSEPELERASASAQESESEPEHLVQALVRCLALAWAAVCVQRLEIICWISSNNRSSINSSSSSCKTNSNRDKRHSNWHSHWRTAMRWWTGEGRVSLSYIISISSTFYW